MSVPSLEYAYGQTKGGPICQPNEPLFSFQDEVRMSSSLLIVKCSFVFS